MPHASDSHARLLIRTDGWFSRVRAALHEQIPCHRGCCRCCVGPFAITALDAAELHRGLASLDEPLRRDIEARAASQTAAIEVEFPRLRRSPILDDWNDSELDTVAERFADLPCPALGSDGSCRVYPFRPLACRTMGIPIEEQGLVHGACEVQTAVPIVRLPRALREEESRLAEREAAEIEAVRRATRAHGEEILLTYGFLPSASPFRDAASADPDVPDDASSPS